jgi:hypothetical protein
MLRVVLGRARPDTEWSGKISGLRFNSAPGVQESERPRGAASTILTIQSSRRAEEVDLEENAGLRIDPLAREEEMSEMDEGKATI